MLSVKEMSRSSHIIYSLTPEEIHMLRDAFIFMDRDNDGHVNRDELFNMVRQCVGDERFGPLEEYINPLFDVADKDKDNKLSLSEFLLSFADGPGVVPGEVINSCVSSVRIRLTDEEIETLQETFRRIDTKEDGYIDKEELVAALKENLQQRFPDLQEDNYNDIVSVIMATADSDCDGRLCLSEFIRSFQEDQGVLPAAFVDSGVHQVVQQLTPAEIEVLNEAFAVLDKDHDGYVTSADIYEALWETLSNNLHDKGQIRELCDLIMVTADRENSEILTLAEFVKGFVRNITLVQLPVVAAQERMLQACDKLQNLLETGELEQLSMVPGENDENFSCVCPNQLVSVLCGVFRDVFPQLDDETLSAVIGAIIVASGNEIDKRTSLEEFTQCFLKEPRILSSDSTSTINSASLTSDELQVVLQVFQRLGKNANSDGCVQELEVLEAIREAFRSDPKQVERVLRYLRESVIRRNSNGLLAAGSLAQERQLGTGQPLEAVADTVVAERAETEAEAVEKMASETHPAARRQLPATQKVASGGGKQARKNSNSNNSNSNKALVASRSSTMGVALRMFGTNTTASDVLMKQHTRRYLDSVYDTADTAIFDDELRMEFKKYANESQYIDREKFVKVYLSMEHYGLTPSEKDVNQLFSKYCKGDKITYNEFCVIMLRRARM